ncbi:HAD domain-containing protein [uncultured Faecalibaculum sp.]|uniref:HAD domain-containing protein n=2 Tax=uncultured Faecalibaculum sp. TaxID=1729681 RepID=UPI0025D533D4|nr:HAD domain-containing protein [uncultured Faecalibaculum sp.]
MGPILYLDIDGVLARRQPLPDFELDPGLGKRLALERECAAIASLDPVLVNEVVHSFDAAACSLIRDICLECSAGIVVTSSWRNVFSPRELRAVLAIVGLGEFMLGCAPAGLSRPDVIRSSLEDLGVTEFAVVDDMNMRHDFGVRSVVPDTVFDEACAKKVRRLFKIYGH